MIRAIQQIRDLLFKDDLFLRVIIVITGLLVAAIPFTAVLLGALSKNYDSALYVLLAVFAIFGLFLMYAGIFGSDHFLDKASNFANSGELFFFLGLVTFAVPITLLIRWLKRKRE